MKTIPFFQPERNSCILGIVNALLAILLTVFSFRYVQPKDCYRSCGTPEGLPCLSGGCRFGEQKAGWPLPVFVDAPGGGSPTTGWGILGPEDLPLPAPMIIDILFYSLLLWLAMYAILLVRGQVLAPKLITTTLLLKTFLAASLWIFYIFLGEHTPMGRGHGTTVYIHTPTDTSDTPAFSPTVSIPLEELIGEFGEPDGLWLNPEGASKSSSMHMILHWGAAGIFVELPQIADNTYVVQKRTRVELIVFSNERQVVGIAEKPLTGDKILWIGYGSYSP